MPPKKFKPLDSAWLKRSIRDYRDFDPCRRIEHAYRISQEVNQYAQKHGDDAAMSKLAEITGDWAEARRLRRLYTLPNKGMIEKAVKHLETMATEFDKSRTKSIDGPKRERRLPTADRIPRTAGISRTHLLTLAGVQNRQKRDKLFSDSIKNGWSAAELKRQSRGHLENQTPLRPSELTYVTLIKAEELLELLRRVANPEMAAAATKVKPPERTRAIRQCTGAIQKLGRLEKQIQPAIEALNQAKSLLR